MFATSLGTRDNPCSHCDRCEGGCGMYRLHCPDYAKAQKRKKRTYEVRAMRVSNSGFYRAVES